MSDEIDTKTEMQFAATALGKIAILLDEAKKQDLEYMKHAKAHMDSMRGMTDEHVWLEVYKYVMTHMPTADIARCADKGLANFKERFRKGEKDAA